MSEQEKVNIRTKLNEGLKKSYDTLLRRKAALGQDMVIAGVNGQPIVVSASDLLAKREKKSISVNKE